MDICILSVLCVVRQRSLRRADHSSRGILPTVVRRCVWSRKPQEWGGHDPRWVAEPQKKKLTLNLSIKYASTLLWRVCYIMTNDRANGYNLSTSQGSYREWINTYFQYQNFKKYYLYAIEHSVFRESYNKQTYMLLQIFANGVFLHSLKIRYSFPLHTAVPLARQGGPIKCRTSWQE
jgi:hypothetical protein